MTPCVLWAKSCDRHGYGRDDQQRAHRTAWQQVHGPIPSGMVVMHLCDNPPCVNVEHLRLGTQGENMADARAKGRAKPPPPQPGEAHPAAKLTEDLVREIRSSTEMGTVLAVRYGVSRSQISAIRKHKTWKHVA